jgi:hypothetical protein
MSVRTPYCGAFSAAAQLRKKELNCLALMRKIQGMGLDESQRKKVAEWVAQGLKLSEIQNRLQSELGLRMTYMEVRLLVDDLKLTPKDVDVPKTPPSALAGSAPNAAAKAPAHGPAHPGPGRAPSGGVSLSVDQIARPGTVVSGRVTFSDGNKAEWYLDQTGRLGLATEQQGYRPPATDVQQFQAALDAELNRMGF